MCPVSSIELEWVKLVQINSSEFMWLPVISNWSWWAQLSPGEFERARICSDEFCWFLARSSESKYPLRSKTWTSSQTGCSNSSSVMTCWCPKPGHHCFFVFVCLCCCCFLFACLVVWLFGRFLRVHFARDNFMGLRGRIDMVCMGVCVLGKSGLGGALSWFGVNSSSC